MTNQSNSDNLLISYKTLRKLLGYFGIALPFLLVIGMKFFAGCDEFQTSVSNYYHTLMRDVFVAIVFAFGIFLITYNGYDKQDRIACRLAAVFALGIALCPTQSDLSACSIPPAYTSALLSKLHLIFATLFFLTLTYISLFLFTKSNKSELGKQKKRRNLVYKICGFLMLGSIITIAIFWLVLDDQYPNLKSYKPVFFMESVALIAFGVSWLTKGEVIFEDS